MPLFGRKKGKDEGKVPEKRPAAGRRPLDRPVDRPDPEATVLGMGAVDMGPKSIPLAGTLQVAFEPTRTLTREPALFIPEGIACGVLEHIKGKRVRTDLPEYIYRKGDKKVPGFLLHLKQGTAYTFGRDRNLNPVRIARMSRMEAVHLKALTRGRGNLPSRLQFGSVRIKKGDRESTFVQHLPEGAKGSTFLAFLFPGLPLPVDQERPWHGPLLEGYKQTQELLPGTQMMLGIYKDGRPRLLPGDRYSMVYLEGVVDAEGNILEDAEPVEWKPDAAPQGGSERAAGPSAPDLDLRSVGGEGPGEAAEERPAGEAVPVLQDLRLVVGAGCLAGTTLWRGDDILDREPLPGERGEEAYRIPGPYLGERKGAYGILIGSGVIELQERIAEFRKGDHVPDLLLLAKENSIEGAHAYLDLREDGQVALHNIGAGRVLLQGPEDEQARELSYQPEPVVPGSIFVIGENQAYRFQLLRS